jgi:hypothetical protein
MLNKSTIANWLPAIPPVVFLILFLWWASSGYPTEAKICDPPGTTGNCTSYSIIFYVTVRALDGLNYYGVLFGAIGTGFIAWFTWTLRQSTEKMWIETKKAADAADLSAKAVTIVEFPIIRTAWIGPDLLAMNGPISSGMSGENYVGAVNDGIPTEFLAVSNIEYRNHGRSPAFPIQMLMGYAVTKKLPDIPVYKSKGILSPSAILKERDSSTIEVHYGFQLSAAERTAITNSEAVLWFYILMTYLDIMDRSHEIGSCWQWGKQNPADALMYFFDNGTAPSAYTKRT